MLDNDFYTKLSEVGRETGMSPQDLLIVMFSESGANPQARNPKGAVGLIQFAPDTLRSMKVPERDIANFTKKSGSDQLDYVKRYVLGMQNNFNHGQPFNSATKYYHANFYPATLYRWHGDDPSANKNVIIVSKFASSAKERAAYEENKGWLDRDKDGKITVGDIISLLNTLSQQSKFQDMYTQLKSVAGNTQEGVSQKSQSQTTSPNHNISNFLVRLDKLLDSLAKTNPKISKYSDYLILIDSNNDFPSKLEFAKILCTAMKERLNIDSNIYSDNEHIEIGCSLDADYNQGTIILKEFCTAISDAFQYATKKIGGIKIATNIVANIQSYYKPLDIKISNINSRKFKIKFLKGTNVRKKD